MGRWRSSQHSGARSEAGWRTPAGCLETRVRSSPSDAVNMLNTAVEENVTPTPNSAVKCCGILKYVMETSADAFQRALYEFGDEKNREAFTPLKDFVL